VAEGALFRRVLARACTAEGLDVYAVPERGTEAHAAAALRVRPAALAAALGVLGRAAGPPWRADQKAAALAAWVALAADGGSR
jgi:hypothetical protein